MRFFYNILILFSLLAFTGCHKTQTHEIHQEPDHAHEHDEITLSPDMAQRLGVECDTVRLTPFAETLFVSGQALNSPGEIAYAVAPSSGIVSFTKGITPGNDVKKGAEIAKIIPGLTSGGDVNLAAKSALENAKRELDRLTPLYHDRLVTASEYNAALANYESALASYSTNASKGRATSPISGTIVSLNVAEGQYVEVGEALATISSGNDIVLKVDVPRSMASRIGSFNDLRLKVNGETFLVSELGGKRTGSSFTNSTTGYVPLYFNVPNSSGLISPGDSFEGYLIGTAVKDALTIPESAISEQMGQYYVYERVDEDGYKKIPVQIEAKDGKNVSVSKGVSPGMIIVTSGAGTLRLAENSKNIPEGHHHH